MTPTAVFHFSHSTINIHIDIAILSLSSFWSLVCQIQQKKIICNYLIILIILWLFVNAMFGYAFPNTNTSQKKYILYRHSIFYRSYPYLLFQALVVLVNLDFDFSLLWLMSLRFFVSCLTSNLSLKIARFAIICFLSVFPSSFLYKHYKT